jgi:tetratricopeptide (TPR) repeat protein
MKRLLIASLLAATVSLRAAAPPRGDARLRELVVFPEVNFNFGLGIQCQNDFWVIASQNLDLAGAIAEQRAQWQRQPGDVKQLMHLAYLLDNDGQTNESRACYQKAEQLCRAKIAAQPQDGFNLTMLGEALDALGKTEAENAYRKATLVASNDWRCWVGLGNYLPSEHFFSLFPTNLWKQIVPAQMVSPAVLAYRPSVEALKTSEAACGEAARCFDRAVALAPKEPEVFFQRAGYLSISNWQNCFFRHYRNNEEIGAKEWVFSFFSQSSAASLQQASKLKPKDYALATLAAYFEWLNVTLPSNTEQSDLNSLPAASREFIQGDMTRLENLSQDADKKTAAGALEHLGFLNLALENLPAAEADLRRAVALDPAREGAWEMLMGMLVGSASTEELLSVCQARLRAKDSVRNRVILGKVYAQKAGNWTEAAKQAEAARKLDTNNVFAPLLLAAIALKQSSQMNYLSVANANLHIADELLKQMAVSDERTKHWRELALNSAIALILENDVETARNWAQAVLKFFPDDETAKEILKAAN